MTEIIINEINQTCEIITDRPDEVEMTYHDPNGIIPLKKPMRLFTKCHKLTVIRRDE